MLDCRFKKITCLLIISLSYFGFLKSQNFYDFILRADSLSDEGLYIEADNVYEMAFEKRKNILFGFYFNAAVNNAHAGNYEKSIDQFILAINKGLIDFDSIIEDPELQILKEKKGWKRIKRLIHKKEKNLNREYIAVLEIVYEKDQLFRQLQNCQDQLSIKQIKIFSELVEEQDSLNVLQVINLIDNNREWLGIDKVGYQGNLTAWLVLQHAKIETQEKYIPFLEDSVLQSNSNAEHLAMLQDRILLKRGKKQIYGTQIKRNKETGKFYVYAIENVQYVDDKRKNIGLPPINDYLNRWNITIENDYVDEIK